ncbi:MULTISPECIES: hypothetical protein [Microbacterium]|uniref:Uncharacterized protein n=1 Tax=Microbacterium sufflavum TaxID=2851649 RepID=A0ABY4ID14_9MICO|nr:MULTISPECIES: hypothetical protein [Microbacterium]MCK2025805.1 hypothetical protein [Microbacterium sufflavum]UPL10637.1 hypothetical protein KV394_05765 [Microbacterium sufflavum]
MPTKHPRTNITHTPQVARALDVARRRWPEEERDSALILLLLEEGARAVEEHADEGDARRAQRLRSLAGRYSGVYGDDYLERVREGWDE